MPSLKQNPDGSMGIQGSDADNGGFVAVSIEYNASSIDMVAFVATRKYVVQGISGRPTIAGTNGSAVTAQVKKMTGVVAITAGTSLMSSTFDLKGTADTVQSLALSATPADLEIPAGTAIGIDFTGTLTSATGVVTVTLAPA